MSNATTLIGAQDEAVEAILALPEQGRRAASFGHTLLNRPPRRISGIRNRFTRTAARLGFKPSQVKLQWSDVCDDAKLRQFASE